MGSLPRTGCRAAAFLLVATLALVACEEGRAPPVAPTTPWGAPPPGAPPSAGTRPILAITLSSGGRDGSMSSTLRRDGSFVADAQPAGQPPMHREGRFDQPELVFRRLEDELARVRATSPPCPKPTFWEEKTDLVVQYALPSGAPDPGVETLLVSVYPDDQRIYESCTGLEGVVGIFQGALPR
jgi:hypothetical protein